MIKHKSKALEKLYNFLSAHASVGKCKALCSDCGGEYTGKKFSSYLENHGIEHLPTEPYTPELNRVAEQFNHTIFSMVCPMLLDSSLPKAYWAEALLTATYIYNHAPHKALHYKTPFKLWTGKTRDNSLSCLRPFGCQVHVLLPLTHQEKLGPHS